MTKKKTAPKTKEIQAAKAQSLTLDEVREILSITIAEQVVSASFREFRTGSKGWYGAGKVVVDGVKCQVSCNVIVIGSKPAQK